MLDYTALYNGYLKASNSSGIDRRMLKRALSPYNLAFPTSTQSDTQLRNLAVQSVLKRYRASKTLLG